MLLIVLHMGLTCALQKRFFLFSIGTSFRHL